MNRLNRDQKQKVAQFTQITNQNENVAISYLQRVNWSVEHAVDAFFMNPPAQRGNAADKRKIEGLFQQYANDPHDNIGPNKMGPNGVCRLLEDLGLEPTDRKVLILVAKFKAASQCEFSQEEWLNGLTALGVDSIDALRNKLDTLDEKLDSDQAAFKEVYNFTFGYGKQVSQRNMDMDTAIAYWQILFKGNFLRLSTWEEFLKNENSGRAISRDTWQLLADFHFSILPDLSNYDKDSAWPVLLDQFVDYVERTQQQSQVN
ncbi:hypothetical protein WR25_18574 [Diploscapter pachys]|uniref:Defective in cullin neddylation protein n=1 Tax=Diploscapter pachys TaxID=2018661 RepID=A0A2A2K8L3_9BILA|nr:hypothetical protein WR25_18574 [Diploscapter pachys]